MSPILPTALEPPAATLSISLRAFDAWLRNASPGARIEYHRGSLINDRVWGMSRLTEKARRELDVLADRAQRLADEGHLILTQERHGDGDYGYLATVAQKPVSRQP